MVEPGTYRLCAGIMLINASGLVFVARRIDTPGEAWQMPQGGIDDGETPRQAALRELLEETGTDKAEIIAESRLWLDYDFPPGPAVKLWQGRYRGQRQKWFAMRFTGQDRDIDLATNDPEFDEWKWVPMDELPTHILPFKRYIYQQLVTEFRHLAVERSG